MGFERVNLGLQEAETSTVVAGAEVVVRRLEGSVVDMSVNPVAFHEACHALAAMLLNITVFSATDVPSSDYLGATFLGEYNPTVAAAAEAMGCAGTGHDLWSIWVMGYDPSTEISNARALLSGHEDELNAVATAIQNSGSASGGEMAAAEARVDADVVEVTVENPEDHTVKREYRTLRRGMLDIPIELPDVKQ